MITAVLLSESYRFSRLWQLFSSWRASTRDLAAFPKSISPRRRIETVSFVSSRGVSLSYVNCCFVRRIVSGSHPCSRHCGCYFFFCFVVPSDPPTFFTVRSPRHHVPAVSFLPFVSYRSRIITVDMMSESFRFGLPGLVCVCVCGAVSSTGCRFDRTTFSTTTDELATAADIFDLIPFCFFFPRRQ
jgi:hypothetical protein